MPEIQRPVVLFDSWVRLTESTDSGLSRSGFDDLRCVLVSASPGHADELAQELRGRGALVVVVGPDGDGLARATSLDPHVVLLDDTPRAPASVRWETLRKHPALRGARPVRFRWGHLRRSPSGPLELDRLAMRLAPLLAVHDALWRCAAAGRGFEASLDRIGSMGSLVRLIANGSGTLRAWVAAIEGEAEVVAVDGLVVSTRFEPNEGETLAGIVALGMALRIESGSVVVERIERPFEANVLLPVDEAMATARDATADVPVRAPDPAIGRRTERGRESTVSVELPIERALPRNERTSSMPPPPSRESVAEMLWGETRAERRLRERRRGRVASGMQLRVQREDDATQRASTLPEREPTTPARTRLELERELTPGTAVDHTASAPPVSIDEQTTKKITLPPPVEEDEDPTRPITFVPPVLAVPEGALRDDALPPAASVSSIAPVTTLASSPAIAPSSNRRTTIALAISSGVALVAPTIVGTVIWLADPKRDEPSSGGLVQAAPSGAPIAVPLDVPAAMPANDAPAPANEPLRGAGAAPPAPPPPPATSVVEAADGDAMSDAEVDSMPDAHDPAARRRRSDLMVAEARTLLARGEHARAEALLLEAHRVASFSPHPAVSLARLYAAEGRVDLARTWIDRAIALRPRRDSYRDLRRTLERHQSTSR